MALITGSDSGIGQATAEEFAGEGADVVVHYLEDDAGVDASGKDVADLPTDMWDKAIRTNLYGAFFCCRRFIQEPKASGGKGDDSELLDKQVQSIPSSERPSQPRSPGWCSWRRATTTM